MLTLGGGPAATHAGGRDLPGAALRLRSGAGGGADALQIAADACGVGRAVAARRQPRRRRQPVGSRRAASVSVTTPASERNRCRNDRSCRRCSSPARSLATVIVRPAVRPRRGCSAKRFPCSATAHQRRSWRRLRPDLPSLLSLCPGRRRGARWQRTQGRAPVRCFDEPPIPAPASCWWCRRSSSAPAGSSCSADRRRCLRCWRPLMVVAVNAVMAMPFAIRAIRPAYDAAASATIGLPPSSAFRAGPAAAGRLAAAAPAARHRLCLRHGAVARRSRRDRAVRQRQRADLAVSPARAHGQLPHRGCRRTGAAARPALPGPDGVRRPARQASAAKGRWDERRRSRARQSRFSFGDTSFAFDCRVRPPAASSPCWGRAAPANRRCSTWSPASRPRIAAVC